MALKVLWIWLNHDEELYISKISALSRVRDELWSDHFKSIFIPIPSWKRQKIWGFPTFSGDIKM